MSERQLALTAALAGVATVDLGGAGAGDHLKQNMRRADAAGAAADIDRGEVGPARDGGADDVWRRILFQAPRLTSEEGGH